MSTKDSLERALDGMRQAPFFNDFMKTLESRKTDVVARILAASDPTQVEVLRGEARAYDYIIKAGTRNDRPS